MRGVVALDEVYLDGRAHLYLKTLAKVLSPALATKPDVGSNHLERAIEIPISEDRRG